MTFQAFMRMYLWIAIACLVTTIVVFALGIYRLKGLECASHFDPIGVGAGIAFVVLTSAGLTAFFATSVSGHGKKKYRELEESEFGQFPIITFPIKIYLLQVILFAFCAATFAPPLIACAVTNHAMNECGPI